MSDYTVIQPNKALRSQAREQLSEVWKQMILAVAIFDFGSWPSIIYDLGAQLKFWEDRIYLGARALFEDRLWFSALGFLSRLPWPWNIVEVISTILCGALFLGFAGYCLKIIRGQEISIKNIFYGFKYFFPSFLLMFFSQLFTILWCLLLIIPGIIKGLGYSMVFFIMYDNPEIKPLGAIKRSSAMMTGYKWKLFKLLLGIIGQVILGLLLILIVGKILTKLMFIVVLTGFTWLFIAYIGLSLANFYENLKESQENTKPQELETAVENSPLPESGEL